MVIIHGENISKSRQKLTDLVTSYKAQNSDIIFIPGKSLTSSLLEEQLGGDSLFGTPRVLVIEELHSLPESAKKKHLIAQLAQTQTEVILWEKRLLTATMLKKFPKATVETFKASSVLFQWLDMLGTSNDKKRMLSDLHTIVKDESAHFCFTMIARQIRLLLSALDDGQLTGAPFIIAKLRKQAQRFKLPQLLALHKKLLEIDFRQKRSLSKLTLEQELDLFVLSI